jgi:UDP-2,3-diacylglucosamine pyrophosphatase LpxH
MARHSGKLERLTAWKGRCRGLCGIVCRHNHRPEIGDISGVLYGNDSDPDENRTALVEKSTIRLNLPQWTGLADVVARDAPAASIGLGEAA